MHEVELAGPDFDDLSLFADGPPYELFARMREATPVLWSDAPEHWPEFEGPGYWNITRAADIAAISRDPGTFSSYDRGFTMRTDAVAPLELAQTLMIGKDPPEHTRMRGLVANAFTPWRVRQVGGAVEHSLAELIDAVCEQGSCDLVQDISAPFALHVIADLLGVPEADRPKLFAWTEAIVASSDPESSAHGTGEQAFGDAAAYLLGLVAERQREPQDDLISALNEATYDGETMPEEVRAGVFIHLFSAGADTTRGTIALGMQALIEHPDQLARLRDEPDLLPGAVEEILRWACVPMYMRRNATKDVELHGTTIAKGDSVILWLASACRDPELLPDPDRFDITRAQCPHHAFGGGGRHFCLGSGLARLELTVAFRELLARLPDIELAGEPERVQSNWLQGYHRMPVRFTPTAPTS